MGIIFCSQTFLKLTALTTALLQKIIITNVAYVSRLIISAWGVL